MVDLVRRQRQMLPAYDTEDEYPPPLSMAGGGSGYLDPYTGEYTLKTPYWRSEPGSTGERLEQVLGKESPSWIDTQHPSDSLYSRALKETGRDLRSGVGAVVGAPVIKPTLELLGKAGQVVAKPARGLVGRAAGASTGIQGGGAIGQRELEDNPSLAFELGFDPTNLLGGASAIAKMGQGARAAKSFGLASTGLNRAKDAIALGGMLQKTNRASRAIKAVDAANKAVKLATLSQAGNVRGPKSWSLLNRLPQHLDQIPVRTPLKKLWSVGKKSFGEDIYGRPGVTLPPEYTRSQDALDRLREEEDMLLDEEAIPIASRGPTLSESIRGF